MKGSGGTEGGLEQFLIGLCLAGAGIYFFLDSVRMHTGGMGFISGMLGGGREGAQVTSSMGIIFVPFGIGVFSLFVDASKKWAWWLTWLGLATISVEILSRIHFFVNMKTSHFMLMLILFLVGCALMFRSYKDLGPKHLDVQDQDLDGT